MKLFSKYSNLRDNDTWIRLNVTDGQTDRRQATYVPIC